MIYLDWNATTPPHATVLDAIDQARRELWANPSSVHRAGRQARRAVEDVREGLAKSLNFSPRDVVFTGGGSEANHLALSGARVLVTSRIEHPSVVEQANYLADRGARVVFADVTSDGVVTPEAVEAALGEALGGEPGESRSSREQGGASNDDTPLVALMAANHETGVIQPIEQVSDVVHRYGARLHVDAVQWLGRGALAHLRGADSVSLAAHKHRGPKGLGALAFACGWTPLPTSRGGAQERGLRPGTMDACAIAGWGAALRRREESESAYRGAAQLGQRLERVLTQHAQPTAVVHGSAVPRMGHVVNFRVPGWKGDELVAALDMEGVCVSSGSACSAGTAEPSGVITEMLSREEAVGAVRVSFGEESTSHDLEQLLAALTRLGVLS